MITIDLQQLALWHELLPLMKSAPFSEYPDKELRYGFENLFTNSCVPMHLQTAVHA